MGNNGGSKTIVFTQDIPEIVGDNGNKYGPFKKGDRFTIPSDARKAFEILLSSGYAKEAFNMVEAALYYRKIGLNPIPLMPKDKRPLMAWERFQTNLITEDEIREIWSNNPDANIGIVTGQVSGIVVVDIDGPDGVQNYKAMNKGKEIVTPSVRTGKGHHYYFKHPKNILIKNKARIAKEIDIRGDGGYVVAPPSIHPSGRPYEWDAVTKNAEFAEIPKWLYEILEEKVSKKNGSSLIEEGSRNNRLASISGRLRNIGLGPNEVQVMLQAYNKQFTTNPLPEAEVSKITTDFSDEGHPVTDMGNALRMKDYFGDDLLYCHSWGKWLIWDSTRWRIDDTGKIMSTAKEVARRILVESTIPGIKPDRVEKLAKWGATTQNRSRLEAMVALAQSELPITPDLLDQDP